MTVTTYTTDATKIATYSFTLTGVLTGDTTTTSTTFSIVIHSQCYGQTLTAGAITTSNY